MADEKSGYPMQQQAAYPPAQPGAYPPAQPGAYPPAQPGAYPPAGGAPPPYHQPQGQPQQAYPYPPPPGHAPTQPQGYAPAPQQPGQTVIIRQTQMQPNDYLGFAIFVTICCCLPFGIVGIIKATEVRNRYSIGDYQGAEESSKAAKNWSCAGLVTGCIVLGSFFVFYVLLYIVILGAGAATYSSY